MLSRGLQAVLQALIHLLLPADEVRGSWRSFLQRFGAFSARATVEGWMSSCRKVEAPSEAKGHLSSGGSWEKWRSSRAFVPPCTESLQCVPTRDQTFHQQRKLEGIEPQESFAACL